VRATGTALWEWSRHGRHACVPQQQQRHTNNVDVTRWLPVRVPSVAAGSRAGPHPSQLRQLTLVQEAKRATTVIMCPDYVL
jgi:hypothetical protein